MHYLPTTTLSPSHTAPCSRCLILALSLAFSLSLSLSHCVAVSHLKFRVGKATRDNGAHMSHTPCPSSPALAPLSTSARQSPCPPPARTRLNVIYDFWHCSHLPLGTGMNGHYVKFYVFQPWQQVKQHRASTIEPRPRAASRQLSDFCCFCCFGAYGFRDAVLAHLAASHDRT